MGETLSAEERLARVREAGVDRLRVHFTDLLGISRNKVVPLSQLDECLGDGINFCIAAFCVDHAGEVIEGTGLGAEVDFRDAQVVPDLDTLTVVPWERSTAIAIGDVRFDGGPLACSPRQLLRRASDELDARGFRAVAGHELEFFLLRPNGSGYEQYAKQPGLVYTLSPSVDTEGVLRKMEDAVAALGLPLIASNQEYFGSQWEINLRYDDALKAADDAHLLKLAVKEIAAQHGLVATFMGKPIQELGTSGYHLHLSLWDAEGTRSTTRRARTGSRRSAGASWRASSSTRAG
jgi:glutamine synthetase